jgi:hypothetical protein
MSVENPELVLDLVEWVAREPRTYEEVMEAWRTSCPRLTIWEDAISQGYLLREREPSGKRLVIVTEAGQALLQSAVRSRV